MNYKRKHYKDIGVVESIGDGIVSIKGLANVANGEIVQYCIKPKVLEQGLVLNLEKNKVSTVIFITNKINYIKEQKKC